jgi:putative endonuclease
MHENISNQKIILGNNGEKVVAHFLQNKNFKILAQNYRTKLGEIDLIAQKDELIVFVEVKTRKKEYFPIATVVTSSKQIKIGKTAKLFILQNNIDLSERICRFDVATVILDAQDYNIEYIENAFLINERLL